MEAQNQTEARNTTAATAPKEVMKRPSRKDFKNVLVIQPNGSVVDPELAAKKITETTPKLRRRQLRENGWTQIQVFDRSRFEKAFADYRESQKKASTDRRTSVITEAFDGIEQGHNGRVERALTVLMPLYTGANERKIADALRKIVRVVSATAPNYVEKPKTKRATKRGAKQEAEAVH